MSSRATQHGPSRSARAAASEGGTTMAGGSGDAFKVTPSRLRDSAEKASAEAKKIDRLKQALDNLHKGMSETWKGEAKTKFDAVVKKHDSTLQNAFFVLMDVADKLRKSADAYEKADKAAAGRVR